MKSIITLITVLLINFTFIFADTKSSFVDINSKFHELDIEELPTDKNNTQCINCHLFEKKLDSISQWLTPQKSIDATIQNLDNRNGEPDSFSKACLMCHDGSAASLVLNAPISPCGLKKRTSVGINGENHPVFMEYTDKDDLYHKSSALKGDWKDANIVSDLLRDNKMVCISCHLPHHNEKNGFLRTSTIKSGLCFGCHNK